MVCFYIKKYIGFDDARATVWQFEMFHGEALRRGTESPGASYSMFEDSERVPMSITKNVYQKADLFSPGVNLIVSEKVKEALCLTRNIEFLEVKFEKLFLERAKNGQMPEEETDKLFDEYEHDPKLANRLGHYYEVIMPRLKYVLDKSNARKKVRLVCPIAFQEATEISESVLDEFPLVWDRGWFMNQSVYHILEKFIDRRFYDCFEISFDQFDECGCRKL